MPDVTKLPKWAQELIAAKDREISELRTDLQTLTGNGEYGWFAHSARGIEEHHVIGPAERVTLRVPKQTWRFAFRRSTLEINQDTPIMFETPASNVIRIIDRDAADTIRKEQWK